MISRWFKSNPKQTGILYFDGVCSLCNKFINFLMVADKGNSLQYSPLQGKTAEKNLDSVYLDKLDTIVYQEAGKFYSESDAVIRAVSGMGGIWKFVLLIKLIPKFIRNPIYRFVAKNRFQWFGKKDACRIPTPEERGKILI